LPSIAYGLEITQRSRGPLRALTTDMFPTIDLSNVFGGAGSDWATGGFWTGRTREEQENPRGWRERANDLDSDR
jgi:hypothetical protein